LLPDHIHCIWDLADDDLNYSRRWSIIKRKFTQNIGNGKDRSPRFWQKRFWAHLINDETDYENHMNYIHYNPVKHGLVERARDWSWTSLHRLMEEGKYPANWGEQVEIPEGIGHE
jgi:putative transposase